MQIKIIFHSGLLVGNTESWEKVESNESLIQRTVIILRPLPNSFRKSLSVSEFNRSLLNFYNWTESRMHIVYSVWVSWEILHLCTHAGCWHQHLLHLLLLLPQHSLYSEKERAKTQRVLGEVSAQLDWQYNTHSVWWRNQGSMRTRKLTGGFLFPRAW